MSTHAERTNRRTDASTLIDPLDGGTRRSREDAVDAKTFEYLVESTYSMDDYRIE